MEFTAIAIPQGIPTELYTSRSWLSKCDGICSSLSSNLWISSIEPLPARVVCILYFDENFVGDSLITIWAK